MLKVVIDTNLLIDAEGDFYSYASRILDAVIAGNIQAFANRATLRENKFITPQKIPDQNYLKRLQYYFDCVQLVELTRRLNMVEDSEDNKILESAVAASADFLITSDQHLLKLEKYNGIKIVNPVQFWNIYQDQTADGWKNWLKKFIT